MKIRVDENGKIETYWVDFQHTIPRPSGRKKLSLPQSNEDWVAGTTRCFVYRGENLDAGLQWIGDGCSSCSPSDEFCKEKGRKISLARAIQTLPRETRTCIWGGYNLRRFHQLIDYVAYNPKNRKLRIVFNEGAFNG